MVEENISKEFKLKDKDEIIDYLVEEINRNELISEKHKKVCTTLNYIKHFLILVSTIARCVLISSFASSVCILIGITSSAIELKICITTAWIKKYKSIIKKKNYKIVLLVKSKLNRIEVLMSKSLMDSVISQDEFVLINNVLK